MYDENIAQKLQVIPSVFTEAVYLIEGKPFRFNGRKYLKTIYDTDIRLGILKTGRQVEKSTTLSIKIGNDVLLKPFSRDLYVAPHNEQVKTFSKERLGKLFRYSKEDIIKKYYMSTDLTDQVFMKEYRNGSSIWLRHCFEQGDNIRGLSIDNLYIDEVQDIMVDALPVIQETQFASDRSMTWFAGTPKTFSNTIEGLWQQSTKAEWIVKCSGCNTYQVLGMKNITDKYLVCRKCGKELTSEHIHNGFWKETNPGKPLKGFHISQMMSPRAKMVADDGKGIYQKLLTYPMGKFQNEVLGLSYENASKLISDKMLDDILDNDEDFYEEIPKKWGLSNIYMGVDWGTGDNAYTVVTVFVFNEEVQKFQLLYAKRYDTGEELEVDHQVDHISMLMKRFNVKLCVVDWGFGFAQFQSLKKRFGERVAACYWVHNQKEKIAFNMGKDLYTVRRTDFMMEYVINMMRNRGALWPGKRKGPLQFLRDHHLAEQAEYRQPVNGKSEEMVLTHPLGVPDDGLHSCIYSYLAMRLTVDKMHQIKRPVYKDAHNFNFALVQSR